MVAATVNGKEITRKEVEQAVEALIAQHKDQIPPDQMEQARLSLSKQMMENLVNKNLLLQEADNQGVEADPEKTEARFKEITQRFSSPEEIQQVFSSMGLSEDSFRQELTENLKIESLLATQVQPVPAVTSSDVDEFYQANPENFKSPEKVEASHILITVNPGTPPEIRTQKRLETARLRGEIDKGADFAQLAQQHSDCPSKSQGGNLGYFERGKMVKPFEEAAFNGKQGDITEVVETQFGYHLIKITGRQEAQDIPLEQVRDEVSSFLKEQNKEEAIKIYVDKLRSVATIEYL